MISYIAIVNDSLYFNGRRDSSAYLYIVQHVFAWLVNDILSGKFNFYFNSSSSVTIDKRGENLLNK